MNEAKADLHLHTKYSDRPSEWILRRIGAPESFVEPEEAYRKAKQKGMDFVTISDHNCIDGALEIAHHEDVFISNEVTTYFPEDRCKIHLLTIGIDEQQFRFIEELRPNIYELRDYLVKEGIAYSVAHPFFRVNNKLTPLHIEKLLLLFNCFEGLNGSRDRRASQLVNLVFRNLTPDWIDRASERHRIEPLGETPWRKFFTGGSDDHGGLYVANAYTVTPRAESKEQYIDFIRRGQCDLGGRAGSSLRLAHSFYEIATQYYRRRFGASASGVDLLGEIFERLSGQADEGAQASGFGFGRKVRGALGRRRMSDVERRLLDDLSELLNKAQDKAQVGGKPDAESGSLRRNGGSGQDWRTFEQASGLVHLLGYRFVDQLMEHVRAGRLLDAFQTFASLAPVGLGVAPYIASFATQHKDESFLQNVAGHFPWSGYHRFKRGGRVWMTDTYGDTNGVARMIQILGEEAYHEGLPLEVVTSELSGGKSPWRRNFKPVGSFSVPEYEMQRIAFPPFLEMIEYLENQDVSEIIISTPGPVGLTGLAAAKLLGLRKVGFYHTDFPAYVQEMTENSGLASFAQAYMTWFYDQMDLIYVPSESYRRQLESWGFARERLALLQRGVDVDQFSPHKRSESFWSRFSDRSNVLRFLYVGRLSEEKNVRVLLDAFKAIEASTSAELCFVGDGPSRDELEKAARGHRVVFTGFLEGEVLATAYASADVFVFPSETDTFGNVVLEAQASGLPALVSTKGGPREIVIDGETGVVVDCSEVDLLAEAMRGLAQHEELRRRFALASRRHAADYRWSAVLDQLWDESPSARGAKGTRRPSLLTNSGTDQDDAQSEQVLEMRVRF